MKYKCISNIPEKLHTYVYVLFISKNLFAVTKIIENLAVKNIKIPHNQSILRIYTIHVFDIIYKYKVKRNKLSFMFINNLSVYMINYCYVIHGVFDMI